MLNCHGKVLIEFSTGKGVEVTFPELGTLTPSAIEQSLPYLYRALTRAHNEARSLAAKAENAKKKEKAK